ncbi:hypothetical protein FJR06_23275, partial [Dolichospermum sp. UHCC 0352]|nr:hypothetical protein [Dolichospermum sp. UHCC 0352]
MLWVALSLNPTYKKWTRYCAREDNFYHFHKYAIINVSRLALKIVVMALGKRQEARVKRVWA